MKWESIWLSIKTSCALFIAMHFKYGGHFRELCVTQIGKYRDLTHVSETMQINGGLPLLCMHLFIIQCYQP